MKRIPLAAFPNQEFVVNIEQTTYQISLWDGNYCMLIDISQNGVPIITGQVCNAGSLLIPYLYLESGNFVFLTATDELPYYTKFGITQSLVYLTQAELDELRAQA